MMESWFKFNLSYPLTILGSVLFLILGSIALASLYTHFTLSMRTEAVVDHWKVIRKSSSSFPFRGSYHFEFQGKIYQGSSVLPPPYHLNRPSAERAMGPLQKKKWFVWFDPRKPSVSSLEKAFPTKKIVYALVALGVTLYFGFVETSSRIRNPTN
jgi:hypothetical protein